LLRVLLPLLWLLSLALGAHAAEPLVLRDGVASYPLGRHLDILEDQSGRLTIDQVTAPPYAGQFITQQKDAPAFGLGDQVFWLRFQLSAPGSHGAEWLLVQNFPLALFFDLYIPQPDGSYRVKRAGKMEPFAEREVPHRNPVFQLNPGPEPLTYYIRAAFQGSLVFPLAVLSRSEFLKGETPVLLGFGLYFGIMLAMALYNLYIGVSLRDRIYLYYVLYVVCFALVQMVLNGFTRQIIFPNAPVADYYAMRMVIDFTAIFSLIFSRSFLRSAHYAPRLDKVLLGLIGLDVLLFPLIFLRPGMPCLIFLNLNTLLTPLLSTIAGVVCYWRGNKSARYYLLARIFLYASVCAYVMGNTVLKRHDFFTWYSMLFCSVLDVILLSLALTDRVSVMREEKIKAEAEAGRAAGRALIGDMAAGVAHEVNNPLAGVILCFQGLKNSGADDPGRPELVTAIESGLARIKETVAQLLNFSRQSKTAMQPADLNQVVGNVLALCKYRLDQENIRVVAELAPDLPRLQLDETKMGQVIANVILNAAHAMRGGGTLTIRTRLERGWCLLTLADTGPGIPSEVLPRIFEPFFTTKPLGEGTGLGLSLSKNIVDAHHGLLEMECPPGAGTTCYIRLPLGKMEGLA